VASAVWQVQSVLITSSNLGNLWLIIRGKSIDWTTTSRQTQYSY